MLARFVWEIHAWAIPLTFATGWVIGYAHWKISLRRKHPGLYDEWLRRTQPGARPDPQKEDRT